MCGGVFGMGTSACQRLAWQHLALASGHECAAPGPALLAVLPAVAASALKQTEGANGLRIPGVSSLPRRECPPLQFFGRGHAYSAPASSAGVWAANTFSQTRHYACC